MNSSPLDVLLPQFRRAAAEGAVLELKLRLLCEVVPELTRHAHEQRLEDAEDAIGAHFAADLVAEDVALLDTSRRMRNKILHGDFARARRLLHEAGGEVREGGVRALKVGTGEAGAQALAFALRHAEESFTPIARTSSTAEGTIYGWLLELGMSGDLKQAEEAFLRASAVIDRLAKANASRALTSARSKDSV